MQTVPNNLLLNTDGINAVNNGTDVPTNVLDNQGNKAFRIKYKSTDGWRGYYYAEPIKKYGWTKLDNGWMTGNYDDAPAEAQSSNVEAKLLMLAKTNPNTDYVVIFLPTSNVFSTAYDVFAKTRPAATKRKLANNTWLFTEPDGRRRVRLHKTDILTELNGQVTLSTGGWDTMTTRERLNRYLTGHSVIRHRGQTYLAPRHNWDENTWTPYRDGMTITDTLTI